MPTVKRDDILTQFMSDGLRSKGLLGKLGQVAATAAAMLFFVLPQELRVVLGLGGPRMNVGRLRTVVADQIYQQTSFSGNTKCTVFKSRNGDGLLIYIAPRITAEFLADLAALGAPVKYIVAPNETHESFADDAKKAFPDAEVLAPRASRDLVEEAVAVDHTLEERWDILEREYGFVKMFRFDDNSQCTSERSFAVVLFGGGHKEDDARSHCLFVAQCGVGNYSTFSPGVYLSGFQSLISPRGRFFRLYYNCFTKNKEAVRPYWTHMVNSVENVRAAVFTHGDPILGPGTKDKLLQFYVY